MILKSRSKRFKGSAKFSGGNGVGSRVTYGAIIFFSCLVLVTIACGQQEGEDVASGSMAEWISTDKIEFTPAIYIDAGSYDQAKSTPAAVDGGKVDGTSATGIKISSDADDFNGLYVRGGDTEYTLSDAVIELSGNGSNDFVGLGTGAMVDGGGTLILKNVNITTSGVISSATTTTGGSTLKVYESTLKTNGGPLPDDYKPIIGAGMMEPPAPLGIGGTARTCLTLSNSESYYYNSTIIADGWGALSTDIALDRVYLEANNCDVQVINSGYGTYADWNCKVVINNSRMTTGKKSFTGIMAGPAEIHLNNTEATTGGSCALIHSVMRDDPAEISILSITGGKIASEEDMIIVKSANADITFDGVQLTSKSGVLIRSKINDDPMATKLGDQQVTGTRATLKEMTVEGNFIHEDPHRPMVLTFVGTRLKGAIKNAAVSLNADSTWTATADSMVTFVGAVEISRINAPAGVTISAKAGQGCTLRGEYKLTGGGALNVDAG
jgi:hypothetical protein